MSTKDCPQDVAQEKVEKARKSKEMFTLSDCQVTIKMQLQLLRTETILIVDLRTITISCLYIWVFICLLNIYLIFDVLLVLMFHLVHFTSV